MASATYETKRELVEAYFDKTAAEAWTRLTSDAPVSGIRATVRAGRDRMRAAFLDALPHDMTGKTLLDAGCGTGALAVEAAARGAHVIAVDLSEQLIKVAQERARDQVFSGSIEYHAGDMLNPEFGDVDYVAAMDCFIHYDAEDAVRVAGALAERTSSQILFTFAPRTPLLAAMHTVGRLFPRNDRSPAITPVAEQTLRQLVAREPRLRAWSAEETFRVSSGFYTSELMRLTRA